MSTPHAHHGRHHRGRFFRQDSPVGCRHRRSVPAEGTASATVARPEPDAGTAQAVRIFTCGGRSCTAAGGGEALAAALRRAIAAAGPAAAHIDVATCGCLGRCKDGPLTIAYGGRPARASRPPEGILNDLTNRPLETFRFASPADAPGIVARLLDK